LLLVARIQYSAEGAVAKPGAGDAVGVKGVCREWDIWGLYFDWGQSRELGKVLAYEAIDGGRIGWARLIAVPLFSITRIEDVVRLMDEVLVSKPDGATTVADGD
jgi:hypothetical protein